MYRNNNARKESILTTDMNALSYDEDLQDNFESIHQPEAGMDGNESKGEDRRAKMKYHLLLTDNRGKENKSKESITSKRSNQRKKSTLNYLF